MPITVLQNNHSLTTRRPVHDAHFVNPIFFCYTIPAPLCPVGCWQKECTRQKSGRNVEKRGSGSYLENNDSNSNNLGKKRLVNIKIT